MKALFFIMLVNLSLGLGNRRNTVHLYGTSLNTKGVSNGNGVNASETTAHSLDDVSQSKTYAEGDDESNARTEGKTIWTTDLQGVDTHGDAVQTGNGNTLADSWSKSFTPTRETYLNNYYSYVQFLNSLGADADSDQIRNDVTDRLNQSIANYENPDYEFLGDSTFDLQQARSSGRRTSASTRSSTFNWGGNNTIQKGHARGSAGEGWATSNNQDWSNNRAHYLTVNKNSAAFGKNAYSDADTNLYIKDSVPYASGNAWGEADGKDAVSYSTVNANNFGYGALSGGTNTYSDNNGSQSVSQMRSNPFGAENAGVEQQVQEPSVVLNVGAAY